MNMRLVDARTARASDFDASAQRWANCAWFSLILILALWWEGPWWTPIVPAIGRPGCMLLQRRRIHATTCPSSRREHPRRRQNGGRHQ